MGRGGAGKKGGHGASGCAGKAERGQGVSSRHLQVALCFDRLPGRREMGTGTRECARWQTRDSAVPLPPLALIQLLCKAM